MNCKHRFGSLVFIYNGDGKYIERVGCADCNADLFPKQVNSSESKGNSG